MAGAGVSFLLACGALASREIAEIRVVPAPAGDVVHLTIRDAKRDQLTWLHFWLSGGEDAARTADGVSSLKLLPSLNVPVAKMGVPLMEVPFSAADKAVFDADPAANRFGFGSYQAGGPEHSYFMGKYEVTNEDFAEFLNSAEANPNNTLGSFTFFDPNGNVTFVSGASAPSAFDMFNISASRLVYTPTDPVGSRYRVENGFEEHPVGGVSWYGAVKYCNWLTTSSGIGDDERCYTEGSDPGDWAPVTATNWPSFTDAERQMWIDTCDGFRLPMVHNTFGAPSLFNEYHKAALWNGMRNTRYGNGRFFMLPFDANFHNSRDPFETGATPVGFYDGAINLGFFTRADMNLYGLFDMSGNVFEWQADPVGSEAVRGVGGGSFLSPRTALRPAEQAAALPELTVEHVGFRIASSTGLFSGTNVPTILELTISPQGTTGTPVEVVIEESLTFSSQGGAGFSNLWSVADTNLGALSATSGLSVVYSAGSDTGLQSVVVSDGSVAVTSVVAQVSAPLTIDPAIITLANIGDDVEFAASGGEGDYMWSITDAAIGLLSTNAGPMTTYTATASGSQLVVLNDNFTAVTTVVSQVPGP